MEAPNWLRGRRGVAGPRPGSQAPKHLASRTTSDGANAAYGTDALGRVRWAQTAESVDSVFTDSLGRDTLAVHRVPALAAFRYLVRSTYDSLGRRSSVALDRSDDDGQATGPVPVGLYAPVAYRYDAAGFLRELWAAGSTTFGYNNDGLLTAVAWANGDTVRQGYTATHALASTRHSAPALDAALGRVYDYDAGRHLTGRFNAAQSLLRGYAYDSAGRLAAAQDHQVAPGACGPADPNDPRDILGDGTSNWQCAPSSLTPLGPARTYTWDAVGNPTHDGGATPPHSGNQLAALSGQTLGYDADGNLPTRSVSGAVAQRLSWNSLGQLTGVWSGPGSDLTDSVTFGYDGWGRRVRKTNVTTGAVTYFVWDGDDLMAEAEGTGRIVAQYAYYPGVDQPHSVRVAPAAESPVATYYYATERPGHVVGLVDGTGALAARYAYEPFGVADTVSESLGGWSNRLRFGAREYDAETGLYYQRARYYDPALGRFISQDPIGLAGGVNLYAYAEGDPVNGTDPYGLDVCTGAQLNAGWVDSRAADGTDVCKSPTSLPTVRVWGTTVGGGYTGPGLAAGGGRGGVGGSAQAQPKGSAPYKPVSACPAFLNTGPTRESLNRAWAKSAKHGGVETGGYGVDQTGNGVFTRFWALLKGATNTYLPMPAKPSGAAFWFHVHYPFPGDSTWGQGPSDDDIDISAGDSIPGVLMSKDSLFWFNPDSTAYGCKR